MAFKQVSVDAFLNATGKTLEDGYLPFAV